MTQNLTLLAFIQLVISIFIGVFFMWLTYKLFLTRFKKKYPFTEINTALGLLLSAVLFSTGYILSGTRAPLLNTLRIISRNEPSAAALVLNASMYISEFLAIGFVVALLVNYVSINLFNALTPDKEELKEISENKYQYSFILAAILIVMALFAREAYIALLDSLVPLPVMPRIF